MSEEPQVCCYTVDGTHHVCRKPLLDDGEVWLKIYCALIVSEDCKHAERWADAGLVQFKNRFRSEEN